MKWASDVRPRLHPRAILKLDRFSGRTILLYPERGLVLSEVAAAILAHCDGTHRIGQIADLLSRTDGAPSMDRVQHTIVELLGLLSLRGLVEE